MIAFLENHRKVDQFSGLSLTLWVLEPLFPDWGSTVLGLMNVPKHSVNSTAGDAGLGIKDLAEWGFILLLFIFLGGEGD